MILPFRSTRAAGLTITSCDISPAGESRSERRVRLSLDVEIDEIDR